LGDARGRPETPLGSSQQRLAPGLQAADAPCLATGGVTGKPRVEIDLLGPLACRTGDRAVPVRSRKQRAILAVLALYAREVVSTERLVLALWGDEPPPSARNSLEAHVSRLRKLLGESGGSESVLRTQAPGYVVDAETDLQEFERLRALAAKKAMDGAHEGAAEELTAALALWRGGALADLADEPFARPEIPRLEELRLATREELVRSRLALGHYQWAIPELEGLVAAYPFREGFRELLMLALYQAGRQADALELYRDTRRLFSSELGLDPSPRLRELEQAILRHDPALQTSTERGSTVDAGSARSDSQLRKTTIRPSRARRLIKWTLPAIGAAIAAALALILTGGSHAHRFTQPTAFGHHLLASIRAPLPSCCGFGFGAVWIVGHHDETLKKIDPATNKIVARYHVAGYQALEPLVAAGSLWIPAAGGDFVRFDPATGHIVARWPINVAQIAWGYDSIWATTRDHQLLRINLRTNRIVSRLRLIPGYNDFDDGIAIGYGSIWITVTDTATLYRIDPETVKIIGRISGFGDTYSWMPLAIGDGSIWTYRITGTQGVVYRIDPYTNTIVARIPIGHPNVAWPNGYILDDGGYVWTCEAGNTMTEIDPRRNQVVGWYKLPESCQEVAYGYGSIWTALYDHSRIYRIDPTPG
jgi:DNA-binding SARP family transcriptional activator